MSAGSYQFDDGSTPTALAEVLASWARGRARMSEVVEALSGQRLLVPLLEVGAGELEGDDADPCAGQETAMAAVALREADGSRAGLAFTGVAAMAAWDPRARPLPEEGRRVAAAVLAEGGRVLVVDAGSATACRIEGLALVRLAQGDPWPSPWEDPEVRRAVVAVLAPAMAGAAMRVRLAPPDGSSTGVDLVVEVRFPPGLPDEVAVDRAGVVADRLAGSDVLRAVFDGVLAVVVGDRSIS